MAMRTLLIFIVLLGLPLGQAVAQPRQMPDMQVPLFLEPLVFPGPDASTWIVALNYRIDREFFISVRNTDTTLPGQNRRMGEIFIELADSSGTSFGRKMDRVDRTEPLSRSSDFDHQWEQGSATFTVPAGSYRFFLEATDVESQRRQTRKDIIVRTPGKDQTLPLISAAAFIEAPEGKTIDSLMLDNFGGDFLFGRNRQLLVGLRLGDDTSTSMRCTWSFKVLDFDKDKSKTINDSATGVPIGRHAGFGISSVQEMLKANTHRDDTSTAAFAIIPVSTALLPLRDYILQLDVTTAGGKHASYSRPVRAVWPEMPFSLKNVDGALDALRFITSGAQLDSLRTGSFEQRRDALEAFWQQRNRTTGSARNDVMAEYYRRVDYAMRNFGTLRMPDGSRSDRGKIYILYGQASRTDRSLNPAGGHMETWFYDRLKKKFVFVDESKNGIYTLVMTAPL
jgi:GWxTD domain-containing protein